MHRQTLKLHPLAAALFASTLFCSAGAQAQTATLAGWALMPANTFADGPTTGQFAGTGAGGNTLPLLGKQSVQGFSAVLAGPVSGSYIVMPDNGFGTQANSADALLRSYAVVPNWKTASGGAGTVSPANYVTGATTTAFNAQTYVNLRDPDHKLGFTIQADFANYYNNAANPLVDSSIRAGRLLTGADLDIESTRVDKNGNRWYGDEFGPFLVKTDASGKVLRSEVSLPGVYAPENPYRGSTPANLGSSRGFEGMAINAAGDRLYTLLEGTVAGDAAGTLRINEFNVDTESYTGVSWRYKLDAAGTNIGDMTAINSHEFLVIERNGATATSSGTPFKKIFRIDTSVVDAAGNVKKTEVVNLMNIADPNDLNGDGSQTFTFPYVTVESVLVLNENQLLVINDNNYPGTGGRDLGSDNTEFLLLDISAVPEPGSWALMAGGLLAVGAAARRRATR